MPYLEVGTVARFAANMELSPEPGMIWVDGDFNQFMFKATYVWEFIGKLPFQFKGSMTSGMDVLCRTEPNNNGDVYIVDNVLYVYNSVVNRFIVIQAAPDSNTLPFELFLEGALEPIPIQGIYRLGVDPLPSKPTGCGYVVINNDGSHTVYNQFGLMIEHAVSESSEVLGERTPMVVTGDVNYLALCYGVEGVYPTEGDVWLNGNVLRTYYLGGWVVLPAGVPYASRHVDLRHQANLVKTRIADARIAHEQAIAFNRLFDEQAKGYAHRPNTITSTKPLPWWRRLWSTS